MKLLPILLAVFALTAGSGLCQAEIYKWKDKEGKVRYSDTPPPSNVKQEPIAGKKKTVEPTGKAPLAPVDSPAAVPTAVPTNNETTPNAEDVAAEQRRRNAEAEKANKQVKEAEVKRRAENCNAAKASLHTYTQGGRVYKMNENGEREYLDDSGFKAGIEKAQQEINENC